MILLGIDVSKFKHDCYLADSNDFNNGYFFTIENSKVGFEFLLNQISVFDYSEVRIGLESTGHYHLNLSSFLKEMGYGICEFNPFQTSLYRKADSFRKTKTDKVDAFFIAKLLLVNDSNPIQEESYHIYELKSLTRYKENLKLQKQKTKNSITNLIDIVFPELNDVVNSIFAKYVLGILTEFSTTEAISNAHITKLSNMIKKNSYGRYGKEKAIAIKSAAKNSIGIKSISASYQLVDSIDLLRVLDLKIQLVNNQIKKIMDTFPSPIMTIPGIGIELGPIIIAEIGDIKKFDSPNKLLAYAGLEPSINQSGTFISPYNEMSKRGSTHLRFAIIQASNRISQLEPTFKKYYEKKKAEGKHHYVALSHVSRKLIRVIFHLLTYNETFVTQSCN